MRKRYCFWPLLLSLFLLLPLPAAADPLPETVPFDRTLTVEADRNVVKDNLEPKEEPLFPGPDGAPEGTVIDFTRSYYRSRYLVPFGILVGLGAAGMGILWFVEYRKRNRSEER